MDKTTTNHPLSLTGLYWSERGEVACASHTPFPQSDTWHWDRWTALEIHDAEAWRAQYGALPRCETCGTEAALPPF